MPDKVERSILEAVRDYTTTHVNGRRSVPTREITEYLIEAGFISEDFLAEAPKLAVDAKVRKVERTLMDQQLGLPEMENIKELNAETGEIVQGYRPLRLLSRDELGQCNERDLKNMVILGHRVRGRDRLSREKYGQPLQLPLWVTMMPEPSSGSDTVDEDDL